MMIEIGMWAMDVVIGIHREVGKTNEPDWEQRQYEITKEILLHEAETSLNSAKDDAESAVEQADLLISELKKEKQVMKRALTPHDTAAKRWKTPPWGGRWSKPFGFPVESVLWFISGTSTDGKSSFVMQFARELCNYGTVLYMSYEERVNQSFQRRMGYLEMNEVQGRLRIVLKSTLDGPVERLEKLKNPKFVVIDSFQVVPCDYPQAKELMDRFPKKCSIWINRERKNQPMGGGTMKLKYICDMKVRAIGYKAYCQRRVIDEAESYYAVWEEGITQTSNNL